MGSCFSFFSDKNNDKEKYLSLKSNYAQICQQNMLRLKVMCLSSNDRFVFTLDSQYLKAFDIIQNQEVCALSVPDGDESAFCMSSDRRDLFLGSKVKLYPHEKELWTSLTGTNIKQDIKFDRKVPLGLAVRQMVVSSDNKYVFGSISNVHIIEQWCVLTGVKIRVYKTLHTNFILSHDDKFLFSCLDGYKKWDTTTGKLLCNIEEKACGSFCSVLSSDDKFLYTCGFNTIKWNVLTNEKTMFKSKKHSALCCSLSSDNKYLFEGTLSGLYQTDTKSGVIIRTFESNYSIENICISSDNRFVLVSELGDSYKYNIPEYDVL